MRNGTNPWNSIRDSPGRLSVLSRSLSGSGWPLAFLHNGVEIGLSWLVLVMPFIKETIYQQSSFVEQFTSRLIGPWHPPSWSPLTGVVGISNSISGIAKSLFAARPADANCGNPRFTMRTRAHTAECDRAASILVCLDQKNLPHTL